jgi:Type ISP C-terminal specificity domain/N-6 DNA Methylase
MKIEEIVARFGERAKAKLSNPAATGAPEDQLRAPFERLLEDIAELANRHGVKAVGEVTKTDLKSRPDYAVTAQGALVGFVELKAPGTGADPRKFTRPHDKEQWKRLRSLPNLLYSDGNGFGLFQNGELVGKVLVLDGDIESSGSKLGTVPGLQSLFESFLAWKPIPPKSAKELAKTTARLCRLLRDEVSEQLVLKSPGLTGLAKDWRHLLFPEASDATFADGYAQAVTFGLLMARAKNISLAGGLDNVAKELAESSSLIGTALRLLTESPENKKALQTALDTLVRVLDAVNWAKISKGDPDAWLYFYEDFLAVYDNKLRKATGSYYTPPQVVESMVRLVDETLRSRFSLHAGFSSPSVTVADPATGTGTFFLGVLKSIVETVRKDQGDGAVAGAVTDALKRIIAFEMQLGPYAVAQLRIIAEVVSLTDKLPKTSPRMYVTNTLADPKEDGGWFPEMLAPLARQRKDANQIMREEPITVVIGNPPYKEKAKGKGSWIESGSGNAKDPAPLRGWIPPKAWGIGPHAKHLRNLYVYFWRWATWKVFDYGTGTPGPHDGVVCFITVAGFLNGPGFQKMRAYLRETCNDIWVIDCSPEGLQPEVNTRIFQGVQRPVCIVLVSRSKAEAGTGGTVRFRSLPTGHREVKFAALAKITLHDEGWLQCPEDVRAPFRPESSGPWSTFVELEQFFIYNGSGVMPGRTWIIAPDKESLSERWHKLTTSSDPEKRILFHAHIRDGEPGDKHADKTVQQPLAGFPPKLIPVIQENGPVETPVYYGLRSFDRQWVIPDARLINQPNPMLWKAKNATQVFATTVSRTSPTAGPALTFTDLVPDLDHYNGRGGRVFPLWRDGKGTDSNVKPALLSYLTDTLKSPISPEDVVAYIAAIAAQPAYTARFQEELSTPGLRVPITADAGLFTRAVQLGRSILWLHTFGERMADPFEDRLAQPPRLPVDHRPTVSKEGAISEAPEDMPDTLNYDAAKQRLLVGHGFIDNVTPAMWTYEVSGKQVLVQWFSSRKRNRERPIIGDRRPPSALGDIQPDHWLPEYTTELLNVLNVLGLLIELEPVQANLLDEICAGPLISAQELAKAGALDVPAKPKKAQKPKTSRKRKDGIRPKGVKHDNLFEKPEVDKEEADATL